MAQTKNILKRKKTKYHFNPHTLQFEKVEKSLKSILRSAGIFLSVSLFFAGIIVYFLYFFYESPKERMLRRETDMLTLQYNLLLKRMERMEYTLGKMRYRDDNIYRVIFEAEPIPEEVRKAGYGGVDIYKHLDNYENSKLMTDVTRKLDIFSKRMYVQSQSYDELLFMAKNKEAMLSAIPAIQPLSNKDLQRIASGFGYRIDPIYKTTKMHPGIDFSAPKGTEIYATGAGVVERADAEATGYGNCVIIDHGYGYKSLYAHMTKFIVGTGHKVKRGEIIGYVGSTGKSIAPHVHYEIIKDGQKIDPVNYFYNDLNAEEYERIIQIAAQANQSFD